MGQSLKPRGLKNNWSVNSKIAVFLKACNLDQVLLRVSLFYRQYICYCGTFIYYKMNFSTVGAIFGGGLE